MPEGLPNFALALLILALKLFLLPRVALRLPAFCLYLLASIAMNLGYLFGYSPIEEVWSAATSILGALAAVEAAHWALAVGYEESVETSRWCLLIGLMLCAAVWVRQPEAYPNAWHTIYFIRLYFGTFSIGFLVAAIMYGYAQRCSVQLYATHAALLLLQLGARTYVLLVHDAANWYWADSTAQAASILALVGWLWLLPRGRDGRAHTAVIHPDTTII